MSDQPIEAFDPDHTPGIGTEHNQHHVVDQSHFIGDGAPGELLTGADGERIEIPPHEDGSPIKLAVSSELKE